MKILFTGGGTGGHFYPIIGVAEAVNDLTKQNHLLAPELYYMAPTPYDANALFENNIIFKPNSAGKVRRYFSLLNFFDVFKTGWGLITATYKVFKIYPDVVFGKGGYASFPALFAARVLRIPVIIHESDSKPGRVNAWAAKFARKIAISYPDAAQYFPQNKVALTGNPVRKEIASPQSNGAYEYLQMDPTLPTVLVLGGSLGSKIINDTMLDALPELLKNYQVIHQTGKDNYTEVSTTAKVVLANHEHKDRYRPFAFMNNLEIKMSAGIAKVIVSRAGSTIFEIAAWGIPSIIIPISPAVSHDQTSNAFAYARSGAAEVIEENNLGAHVLIAEIERIVKNSELSQQMSQKAKVFAKPDAAQKIAQEILNIALEHEA